MSLRLKLLIAVIVLAFAGLVASDIVTYTSLRSFLFTRVDQQLQAARFPVLPDLQEPGGGPFSVGGGPGSSFEPQGTYAELRDASGNLLGQPLRNDYGARPKPDPILPSNLSSSGTNADRSSTFTTGAVGGGSLRYRVRVDPVQNNQGARGTLVVAIPLTDVDQTLGHLRLIEGLVSAAVVVALGLLLWWLVRRELRPLEEIGVTAGAIAAGDLTRRVEPTDATQHGDVRAALRRRRASSRNRQRLV